MPVTYTAKLLQLLSGAVHLTLVQRVHYPSSEGRWTMSRSKPALETAKLDNPWANVIPGLYPAILVDTTTGEIVGYPESRPKSRPSKSSDYPTVAATPRSK